MMMMMMMIFKNNFVLPTFHVYSEHTMANSKNKTFLIHYVHLR